MTNTTKAQRAEQAEAIADLRNVLHPGDIVWTSFKYVSSSGMHSHIGMHTVPAKDEVRTWTYSVAKALGLKISIKDDGLVIGGTGMDMGFHVVYSLSRMLFDDGYALRHRWLP